MKGLKQHILDFEVISTGNPKTFVFIDSSEYYTAPDKPTLDIKVPGRTDYLSVSVVPNKVNTFNSTTIGLTEYNGGIELSDLPDGIYHLIYKICPYEFLHKHKAIFRTTLIEKKLSGVYDQLELTDCSKKSDEGILESLVEIHVLIEGAKLMVCTSETKAQDFYNLANTLIDKISNKLCKTCH